MLVREDALIGTGAFPSDEANVYELPADDLYLAGTAEIPVASLHAREILPPTSCRSATSRSHPASGARRAPPAATRAA